MTQPRARAEEESQEVSQARPGGGARSPNPGAEPSVGAGCVFPPRVGAADLFRVDPEGVSRPPPNFVRFGDPPSSETAFARLTTLLSFLWPERSEPGASGAARQFAAPRAAGPLQVLG